jgi:cephalosporin hydroxylase
MSWLRKVTWLLARQIPALRDYMERFEELARQNAELHAESAQLLGERKMLLAKLATAQNAPPASGGAARSIVGPYSPPPREIALSRQEREIVDRFHDLYYTLGQKGYNTNHISWLGHSTLKCPLDLWIYQEIISRSMPDVIIETGTASGGSALYLASMCELVNHGEVITIDVDNRPVELRPVHPRLSYLVGSSVDPGIIDAVKAKLAGRSSSLVILDSDHRAEHVLAELRAYQHFVPVGGYLVVEDTNVNGHPTYPEFGPGPMEALDAFLRESDAFKSDATCERFLMTMNPKGYLRRTK